MIATMCFGFMVLAAFALPLLFRFFIFLDQTGQSSLFFITSISKVHGLFFSCSLVYDYELKLCD
jgi:hypothetical protein